MDVLAGVVAREGSRWPPRLSKLQEGKKVATLHCTDKDYGRLACLIGDSQDDAKPHDDLKIAANAYSLQFPALTPSLQLTMLTEDYYSEPIMSLFKFPVPSDVLCSRLMSKG